ncbi:autoinducer binding domain-containing protein [Rhizobium halophytocola]|uniref:DNA-binding CsgD family transcriptional regulator n=1 Tax=Rhizobium halophytocola TaxID=735519 RepID=A0ABS4E4F4_9HYPH|nr:autoinducer binding domain-containing protein [Rhizobium halophytocola]MBP1852820.1 DNA-binding CsgD family transcriptional regulator [Rhizobium halophytocola]
MANKLFYEDLMDACTTLQDTSRLDMTLKRLGRTYGFDYHAYIELAGGRLHGSSSYPDAWKQRYLEEGYLQIDPVIAMARRKMQPFRWSGESRRGRIDSCRGFFREARDFGIYSGVSLPIPLPFGQFGLLTLASALPDGVLGDTELDAVWASAAVARVHASLSMSAAEQQAKVELTPREQLCLNWLAEGKSMVDIGLLLGVEYSTVRFHMKRVRQKLHVVTLTQAISVAMKMQLI